MLEFYRAGLELVCEEGGGKQLNSSSSLQIALEVFDLRPRIFDLNYSFNNDTYLPFAGNIVAVKAVEIRQQCHHHHHHHTGKALY